MFVAVRLGRGEDTPDTGSPRPGASDGLRHSWHHDSGSGGDGDGDGDGDGAWLSLAHFALTSFPPSLAPRS